MEFFWLDFHPKMQKRTHNQHWFYWKIKTLRKEELTCHPGRFYFFKKRMCLYSCLIYQCSTLHNLNVPLCSTPFIKKLFLAIFPMLHSLNSLRFHILNTTLPFYKILNLPTFSLNMKPKTSIFFVNHSSSTLLCYHINIVDLPIYQPKQHQINFVTIFHWTSWDHLFLYLSYPCYSFILYQSVSCFLIFFLIILSYPLISLKYLCGKFFLDW